MICYNTNDLKDTSVFWAHDISNMKQVLQESKESNIDSWLLLLVILRITQFQDCEDEQSWNEFCEEVLHSKRFFPQSEILNRIKEIAPFVTSNVDVDRILYRSRIYDASDYFCNDFVKGCMRFVKKELPELSIEEQDFKSSSAVETILSILSVKPGILDRIRERYTILKEKQGSFWGFSEAESDAPPEHKTRDMRANPRGVRYLYAAEDINTAIIEMRPQPRQSYSVATIRINERVKLFDFTKENIGQSNEHRLFSLRVLDKVFSSPNYGDSLEYLPTQCICEYIKLLGFDGIRYNSSLAQDGKNIVLFDVKNDTKKYKIEGSEVFVVEKLKIDYARVFPLPEEVVKQWGDDGD